MYGDRERLQYTYICLPHIHRDLLWKSDATSLVTDPHRPHPSTPAIPASLPSQPVGLGTSEDPFHTFLPPPRKQTFSRPLKRKPKYVAY